MPPSDSASTWPSEITRVVFVCTRIPEMSGGAVAAENLSHAFAKNGIEINHLSVWPGEDEVLFRTADIFEDKALHLEPALRSRVTGPGSLVRGVSRWVHKQFSRRRTSLKLRRILQQYGPETAFIYTDAVTITYCLRAGVDPRDVPGIKIGQFHAATQEFSRDDVHRTLMAGYGSKIDAVTALCDEDAQIMGRIVDKDAYGVGNPVERTEHQSDLTSKKAVALARLDQEKNLDLLIRAFAAATSDPDLHDWTLTIYGEGPMRKSLEQEILESGAADRISLAGRTSDIESVYAGATVNLLACRCEGFGMTIIEAGRAGVPSLSFDCSPGVRSLLGDGHGVLVSPMTDECYENSLREFLGNSEEIHHLGKQARAMAKRFTPESLFVQWSGIMREQLLKRDDR